jgi:hypothetical protein
MLLSRSLMSSSLAEGMARSTWAAHGRPDQQRRCQHEDHDLAGLDDNRTRPMFASMFMHDMAGGLSGDAVWHVVAEVAPSPRRVG